MLAREGCADASEQGQFLDQPLLGLSGSGFGIRHFALRALTVMTAMPKKHLPQSRLTDEHIDVCMTDGTPGYP